MLFGVFGVLGSAIHLPMGVRVVGFIGFGVAWLSVMHAHIFSFRCPACRARLAPLLMTKVGIRIDPRIRCCPYCAVSLDEETSSADAVC